MKNNYLAPNGKPSNLTPEQYKLVRTPEFKAWFGDWENLALTKINDSGIDEVSLKRLEDGVSKVVDENGEPLVVYHGTNNEFNVFDFNKADIGFHFGTFTQAKNRLETKLFFKGSKSNISMFFLNIKSIYQVADIGDWEYPQRYLDMFKSDNIISESEFKKNGFQFLNYKEDNKKIRDFLIKKYNNTIGFEYNNKYEDKGKSYIVIHSNQIKLADGTNTTFDSNNNDIRFEDGGFLDSDTKYKKGGMTNKGYVSYKDKYNKKYGYADNESHDLEEISKDTGVSMKGLQQIYNKGIGAYKTNPQSVRPNVKSKEQWAMARVYSAVMGGKASKIDSNELKMNLGGNVHIGESTEFYERTYADGTKERFSIEDYKKNIYPLLEKQMENKKFDGGGGVGKLNYADGRKFRIRVKQKKG